MKVDTMSEVFQGHIKCTSINVGAGKWKTGSFVLEYRDGVWHLNVVYNCGGNRSYLLTTKTLSKAVCNENGVFIDIQENTSSKDFVTVSFRPAHACKRNIPKLQSIMKDIQNPKLTESSVKSEVGLRSQPDTTPTKTALFSSFGSTNNENSANNFTSVRSVKREEFCSSDEKENLSLNGENSSSDQFLQRGADKSRQCLSSISFYGKSSATNSSPIFKTSTPARPWLSSKRGPGLMPDPTPIKKPRLLSDSISYSMKPKQPAPADSTQQHALQGFSNLGNTCYMNAILQSLFGLDTFATDLTINRRLLRGIHQHSLFYALVKLLFVRRQNNSSDLTRKDCLRKVKSAISSTAKRFLGYGQHDAHEFLCQVLDQLKEEVIKQSKSTPTPNKENGGGAENDKDPVSQNNWQNPITVNFEFEVLHTLTCLQCQEQVCKTEQFHDISLDVPKQKDVLTPRSLQDALSMFFRDEQIDYTCEKCGHSRTDVSHKITRLPRVFILHLKRYTYSQTFAKNRKMGQGVSVPTFLTMENHCMERTQPAYPPELPDTNSSDQKSATGGLNDSREDNPSRRKLEYPGYRFKSKSSPSAGSMEEQKDNKTSLFTETKLKKDEVDTIPPRVLTLEDEDDPEIARAIELSLREQEERDKMCQYYGDDSESNFEQVMEISRQEHHPVELPKKKMEDMTFDEQMELAIQQSLMETDPYHHSDNTQFDDVINNGDHMYTKTYDVNKQHDPDENYDIGPDGDNYDRFSAKNSNTYWYSRKRSNSDSAVIKGSNKIVENEIFTSKETPPHLNSSSGSIDSRNDTSLNKNECKGENARTENSDSSVSPSKVTPSKKWTDRLQGIAKFSSEDSDSTVEETDLICQENLPDDFEMENTGNIHSRQAGTVTEICGYEEDVNAYGENCDLNLQSKNGFRRKSDNHQGLRKDSLEKERADIEIDEGDKNLVIDENSNEVPVEFLVGGECECDQRNSYSCENCRKNRSRRRNSSLSGKKLFHGDGDSRVQTKEGSDKNNTENGDQNEEQFNGAKSETSEPKGDKTERKETGIKRKCQLTNEPVEKNGKLDDAEESFMEEDDAWMSLLDDKENKIPAAATPKLSDPSEFDFDTEDKAVDEVDAYVEEHLDLPIINNEKGELPYSYRLVSIVNHMGISSATGHYISDVYDMKKKAWFSFDDSHVTKISEADVKTKRERSGYIFFYLSKDIFDDLSLQNAVSSTAKK